MLVGEIKVSLYRYSIQGDAKLTNLVEVSYGANFSCNLSMLIGMVSLIEVGFIQTLTLNVFVLKNHAIK